MSATRMSSTHTSSAQIVYLAMAVFAGATAPAMAGNAGASLGDCYNHVISVCNKNPNVDAAHACANSGMDACDKEHSASIATMSLNLKAKMRRDTAARIVDTKSLTTGPSTRR